MSQMQGCLTVIFELMNKSTPTDTSANEGDLTGEWRTLSPPYELTDANDRPAPVDDPYNRLAQPTSDQKPKRRSLDDMRRLSEAIKAAPAWTPPKKLPALFQKLALLRTDLECVLLDIKAAYEEAKSCADQERSRTLIVQLRSAAEHIECALDELMPPEEQ